MPRDPSRNLYITIGIPRDSVMYQQLVEEGAETGLALSQVVVVRLADYYRGRASVPAHTEEVHTLGEPQPLHEPIDDLQTRAAQAVTAWTFDEE